MPRPNKRKQQISALPRNQGRYESQEEKLHVEIIPEEISPKIEMIQEILQETATMQEEIPPTDTIAQASSQIAKCNLPSTEISEKLEMRLKEVNQQCAIVKSSKANASIYNYLRLLSISSKGDYTAKHIRKWENHYVKTGELLVDHFSNDCQAWLHQQKPESRSPEALKIYIEGTVFPQIAENIKKNSISERTCRTYMHLWGFRYNEKRKGVYYDGHERPDVVIYRREWLNRMFTYRKYMKTFDGDILDIVLEPKLGPGEKEIVQVTHDKCHFYANDGQRRIWIGKNEDILCPKGEGRSVMVSAFLCSCHGLLQLSDKQMRANLHIMHKEAFILCSIQLDGYWKSEHMLEQLVQQAILIFEVLHSGCIGVFCFDQSTNHNAIAENTLVATKMNLGPGGVQPIMRDGWYINENGVWTIQSMVFSDNYKVEELRGKPKGIKEIIMEPLEEAVLGKGHILEQYPKFHCECNFIERYWGYIKRETRKLCNYNYTDLLQQVPKALVNVPVTTIRKFACKSWRYMDTYDKGLEGRAAKWAVTKYKSHRRLPVTIEKQIDSDKE
ncbi:11272_t:CDS:2 [Scutellospora calospora]|uniref:11272_t:CDS:1 n=1 Tax=Scutellospora calospora TaxID=85575 RepID=A0ACA9MAW7_9GLOM|nr:11272_t:CDS:2 [Scutellospora calospora]